MIVRTTLATVLIMLSACSATPSKHELATMEQAKATAPVCASEAACAAMWTAAHTYLTDPKNKFLPIEIDTPTEILTLQAGSPFGVGFAAQVKKSLIAADTYRIDARFGMYGMGSAPNYSAAWYKFVLQFNQFVTAAAPPAP